MPYGTAADGDTYFSTRLGGEVWDAASTEDKNKALTSATMAIDALAFRGVKNAVYVLYSNLPVDVCDPPPTLDCGVSRAALAAADASQPLQFPRGADTTVPADIEYATYEEALALLTAGGPNAAYYELARHGIQSEAFTGVSVTYAHTTAPAHLANGILSAAAWRYLVRYLRDKRGVRISRV
jgi:hypothetical protein